jgi:hypothetical protein
VRWACVLLVVAGASSYFVQLGVRWNGVTAQRVGTFSVGSGGGVVQVGWWRHQVLGGSMGAPEMANRVGGEGTGWRGWWRATDFERSNDGLVFSVWPRVEWRTDSNARERNLVATLRLPYAFLILWLVAGVYFGRFCKWWRARRAEERLWRGHCPVCDYDLRGGSGRCPECGSEVSAGS